MGGFAAPRREGEWGVSGPIVLSRRHSILPKVQRIRRWRVRQVCLFLPVIAFPRLIICSKLRPRCCFSPDAFHFPIRCVAHGGGGPALQYAFTNFLVRLRPHCIAVHHNSVGVASHLMCAPCSFQQQPRWRGCSSLRESASELWKERGI